MIIIRDVFDCPAGAKGAVVAVGNFDGVHIGHRSVLEKAKDIARNAGVKLAVMTFEPHPRMYFAKTEQTIRIDSFQDKAEKLKALGVEVIFPVRFNRNFSSLSAEDFIGKVLVGALGVKAVVTGADFVFGKGRTGNAVLLEELSQKFGYEYHKVSAVSQHGEKCSSTAIRKMIAEADFAPVRKMLGDYYSISGRVVKGDGVGRQLGYPTANVHYSPNIILPPYGIFACFAEVDGKRLPAAVSFGMRPTFNKTVSALEAHILDFSGDLYFKKIRVYFVQRIRDEKRFDSIEDLKKGIESDIVESMKILKNVSA